jgi:hypothetical protein
MAKTRKAITISIKEDVWKYLKDNKIRVSTIINSLLSDYVDKKESK